MRGIGRIVEEDSVMGIENDFAHLGIHAEDVLHNVDDTDVEVMGSLDEEVIHHPPFVADMRSLKIM